MGSRNRRLMCYKSPGVEDGKSAVRPLSPEGMATACRYQAGPQLILARRPTSRAIGLQLKIVAPSSQISQPRLQGILYRLGSHPWVARSSASRHGSAEV